jgi:hypothetical protein
LNALVEKIIQGINDSHIFHKTVENAKRLLLGDERRPSTIAADSLGPNESAKILARFPKTVNWDQSFTSTRNVFVIPFA